MTTGQLEYLGQAKTYYSREEEDELRQKFLWVTSKSVLNQVRAEYGLLLIESLYRPPR